MSPGLPNGWSSRDCSTVAPRRTIAVLRSSVSRRKVATLTLNRPEKKNPLTFESYAEIGNIFRAAAKDKQVKAFVITGEGGNFCSGGDVFEIIGPLIEMDTVHLLEFTRMTGEAVKAMRQCPQPIVAAIDG